MKNVAAIGELTMRVVRAAAAAQYYARLAALFSMYMSTYMVTQEVPDAETRKQKLYELKTKCRQFQQHVLALPYDQLITNEQVSYLYIYGVTAAEHELQGADFLAFKGFLQESFRQHDYAVGRLKAHKLLNYLSTGAEPFKLDPSAAPKPEDTAALEKFIATQPQTLTVSEGNDFLKRFSSVVVQVISDHPKGEYLW